MSNDRPRHVPHRRPSTEISSSHKRARACQQAQLPQLLSSTTLKARTAFIPTQQPARTNRSQPVLTSAPPRAELPLLRHLCYYPPAVVPSGSCTPRRNQRRGTASPAAATAAVSFSNGCSCAAAPEPFFGPDAERDSEWQPRQTCSTGMSSSGWRRIVALQARSMPASLTCTSRHVPGRRVVVNWVRHTAAKSLSTVYCQSLRHAKQ